MKILTEEERDIVKSGMNRALFLNIIVKISTLIIDSYTDSHGT